MLVLDQDSGSPIKGLTHVVKLAELDIRVSYNRPDVSDDNAYAESLFRACKYCFELLDAIAGLDEARQ